MYTEPQIAFSITFSLITLFAWTFLQLFQLNRKISECITEKMLKENGVWETAKQTKLSENPDLGSWYTTGQFFGVRDIYEIWVTGS